MRLRAVTGDFTSGLSQASRQVTNFAATNERQLRRVGLAFGAVGLAAGAGLKMVSDEAVEFDATMTKLSTQIGLAGDEIDELRRSAVNMEGTGKGAQELGEAMFFAASSGLRGAGALKAVEQSAKAASIGLGDTATVTNLSAAAMNAYGEEALSAGAASDVLLGAVREGQAEAEDFAGSLGQVLPIASNMGVQFDEVGAAVAAMTRTGTDAGTATIQLRQILSSLLKPTEDTESALAEMGMSAQGVRDKIREDGLWEALSMLSETVGDNENALGRLFPNVRALSGFLDLTGESAEATAGIFERMADTTGLVDDAVEEWADTAEGRAAQASAAWENARVQLGEATLGMRADLADLSQAIASTLGDLDESSRDTVVHMGAATTAVGTLGGAALIAGPRIVETTRALGGMRSVMMRGLGIGAVTFAAFELVDAFNEGRVAGQQMIDQIIEDAPNAEAAIRGVRDAQEEHVDETHSLSSSAERMGNALLGPIGAFRNAKDALEDSSLALKLWGAESEVAGEFAEENASAFSDWAEAADPLGVTLGAVAGNVRETAQAAQGSGDAAEEAAFKFDTFGTAIGDLPGIAASAFSALAAGMGVFDVYQTKTQEAAEGTDQSVEDIGASWDRFQASQEQVLEDQRNWMDNLQTLRERGFDDLAADLAARGPEQAGLVAEAADQSNAELEAGEQRALDIREQNAEAALAQLRASGAQITDESGGLAADAAEAIADELGVTPGVVESILADTNTLAQAQLDALEASGEQAAANTIRAMARELGLGAGAVSSIVSEYAAALKAGLDPVLTSVGGEPVILQGSGQDQVRDWQSHLRNRAAGGIDAHIAGSPSVLFGEAGPEAFIPLYEGHGASRERSVQIWEETGRRLGIDPEPTAMAEGGFRSPDAVPDVPGLPFSGAVADAGRASMEHARAEAVRWLEENLAPELGSGVGWEAMWEALSREFPAAQLISAFRPGAITATGNPSYHGMGRAVDVSPRMDIFNWLAEHYPGSSELIFSPAGGRQLHNGSPHVYGEPTRGDHWDHIHWAMARGGIIPNYDSGGTWPAGTVGINSSGSDETVIPGGMAEGSVYEAPDGGAFLKLGSGGDAEWFQATGLGQLAGIEALFGDAQQRPSSHIGAVQGSVVDLFGGPGGVEDAVENLRQIRFEAMGLDEQIADVEGRLAEETPFSDEWMRLFDDRSRLLDEQERNREQAAEEQRRRDEEIAENRRQYLFEQMDLEEQIADVGQRLKNEQRFSNEWMRLHDERESLLEEQRRREEQAAQERIQREEDIAALVRDFEEDRAGLIGDRADSLAGWVDATRQMSHDRGIFAGQLEANVVDQTERMREAAEGLSTLRDRGLSQEAIEHLGLRSPSALGQIRTLLHDDPEAIADLSEAFEAMLGEAEGIAEGEAEDSRTRLSDDLASLGDDVVGQLQELDATMVEVRDLLGGKVEGLPEFAHGGMVPGSGPQRIVAHGGERILSQSDNRALVDAVRQVGSGGLRAGDRLTLEVEGQPITAIVRREQAVHDRAFESEMAGR